MRYPNRARRLNDDQKAQLRTVIREEVAKNPRAITPRVIAACRERYGFTVTGPTVTRYWQEVIEKEGSPEPPEGKDAPEVRAAIERPAGSHPHRKVGPIAIARPSAPEMRDEPKKRTSTRHKLKPEDREKLRAKVADLIRAEPRITAGAAYRRLGGATALKVNRRSFTVTYFTPVAAEIPMVAAGVREEEDHRSRDRDETAQPPVSEAESEAEAAPLETPAPPADQVEVVVTGCAEFDPRVISDYMAAQAPRARIEQRSPLGTFIGERDATGQWRIVEFSLTGIDHDRFLEFAADAAVLLFPTNTGGAE